MSLKPFHYSDQLEAGCDEAGRGCLAGPVIAAAVILPYDFKAPLLNDSKELTPHEREELARDIKSRAMTYAYGFQSPGLIDQYNILQASLRAMDFAVRKLTPQPEFLLIDGKHYLKDSYLPYECIIKGDGKYKSIAAASILAKTLRDQIMEELDLHYPSYNWKSNKGYPTPEHKQGLQLKGVTKYHRKTYKAIRALAQQKIF